MASQIAAEDGRAYIFSMPQGVRYPYFIGSDEDGNSTRSNLEILEDGTALGPSHSPHDEIRAQGGGRFSHWNGTVYFSASDDSDPRKNGRAYRVRVRAEMWPHLILLAAVLILWAIFSADITRQHIKRSVFSVRRSMLGCNWISAFHVLWMYWLRFGRALALLTSAVIGIYWLTAPTFEFRIKPSQIASEVGRAYVFSMPPRVGFPYSFGGDEEGTLTQSSLEILEQGQALGPSHSLHDEIRGQGGGRFSLWNGTVYFSTSDGSDPRRNGRAYIVRAQAGIWPQLILLACGLTLWAALSTGAIRQIIGRALFSISTPTLVSPKTLVISALVAVGTVCTVLFDRWHAGRAVSIAVASFLPVSDASGYRICATEFLSNGGVWPPLVGEWCSRRSIYPSFLAGIMAVTNFHPWLTYVIEAILIVLGILSLSVVCMRELGIIGALLTFVLLLLYASEHAIGVTMTEVFGLAAGTTGIAMLVSGVANKSLFAAIFGLSLLSTAMFARAGAIPVLPVLAVWILWWRRGEGSFKKRLTYVILATAAGFLLQWLVVEAQGLKVGAAGGNFSTVLYRLSIGADNWARAYSDHPELFNGSINEQDAFRSLYRIAFNNIINNPQTILLAYIKEAKVAAENFFVFGVNGAFRYLLIVFLFLGLIRSLRRYRESASSLLLVALLAEFMSAPLLFSDGGPRLFAATVGFRAVLVAAGASYAVKLMLKICCLNSTVGASSTYRYQFDTVGPKFALGLGVVLVALVLIPNTPLVRPIELTPLGEISCNAPYAGKILRIDRDTLTFSIVSEAKHSSVIPFRIGAETLRSGMPETWFSNDFISLSAPITLIQGIDRSTSGFREPARYLWHGLLPVNSGLLGLCVSVTSWVDLAGAHYYEIHEIKPVSN
ncbi:hypothetical protein [Methyloterricola oryzae]|uniref:hypothetical protein n=1 Tax=Methyloterricola oryzae TaxID=1495050 RepID=UPI0011AF5E85|nr:hypothetical protein [Methyloterricola oryzae]